MLSLTAESLNKLNWSHTRSECLYAELEGAVDGQIPAISDYQSPSALASGITNYRADAGQGETLELTIYWLSRGTLEGSFLDFYNWTRPFFMQFKDRALDPVTIIPITGADKLSILDDDGFEMDLLASNRVIAEMARALPWQGPAAETLPIVPAFAQQRH